MRIRMLCLTGFVLLLGVAASVDAKRPLATQLDVAPNPARLGEALSVNASLTNNSNDMQVVTVLVQMHGPCGVNVSRGYKVLLDAHATDASKSPFRAPSCPGAFEATLTASDPNGALLGTAAAKVEVTATGGAGGK
jgi:hypothetical protein